MKLCGIKLMFLQNRQRAEGGFMNKMKALTVGTYSLGNLFVVYEINRHVLPTAPSPTTTHLMVCILIYKYYAIDLDKIE